MDIQTAGQGIALVITAILAVVTFRRGTSSEKALDVATNIQSTYNATLALVNELQEEIGGYKDELRICHKERAEAKDEILKLRVTVERHERTIQELQRNDNG